MQRPRDFSPSETDGRTKKPGTEDKFEEQRWVGYGTGCDEEGSLIFNEIEGLGHNEEEKENESGNLYRELVRNKTSDDRRTCDGREGETNHETRDTFLP